MKRWMKYGLLGASGLLVIAAAAVLVGAELGDRKQHRKVEVSVVAVPPATDTAAVARGRYLFMSRGCAECHGPDGAGRDVVNDGKGFLVHSPNITPGPNNVVARYAAVDWVRTIRHGVKPSGQPVLVMPSEDYNRFTDSDLAALVGFVSQMPPAQGGGAAINLPLPMKALYGFGLIPDAASKIDHTLPPSQPVTEAVSAEHGAYVANACIGCHGAGLAGGKISGGPPDWPPAANLTPGTGTVMGRYPDAQAFAAMLRSGKRPDGTGVSTVMPFASMRELSDTDVQALYLHLKRLKPLATGEGR